MRLPHYVALVVLSTLWGSAFMLVKVALDELTPLTLVEGRLSGAALFLATVLVVTGRSLPRSPRPWLIFAVMGVVNMVFPFTLLAWGQQHIESSQAAILVASMPLSTGILAHFWINERLTTDRALGVLVGFAGVFVLIGGDLGDLTESSTLAQLAVLVGVFGYAVGTVFARRYLQDGDPVVFATGQTIVAAAIMAPVALAVDQPFDLAISAKVGLSWATLGLVNSGVAYLLFFWLLQRVTATQASMVTYLVPVTALFLGALVLDERLGANSFVGLAVIVAGVWIVNGGGSWLAQRVRGERAAAEVGAVGGGADGEDGPRRPPAGTT